ncbi:hypothetical protein RI367_008369 [Sorochytrium milnesiophthora]
MRPLARAWTSRDIRAAFVDAFVRTGHVAVPSSSLVPHNDNSLLFTNAGMVQFKSNFMYPEKAPHKAAVSVQKCLRAGGKHNDLDNVGYTPRHHTFFEMLGNFSFGKYGKQEAIRQAWSFLTKDLEMPVDRLGVTVLKGDQESFDIWHRDIGLAQDRIRVCGPDDNFWSMGPEGPCGPCSEIFWDTGNRESEDARWLEIWNLVFMQFHRHADGTLDKLPTLCVDTGMGLERLACVLQGKADNFETDVFSPITSAALCTMHEERLSTLSPLSPNVKILADHIRSASFLIADGVMPSYDNHPRLWLSSLTVDEFRNVNRGYVLRRIIRRALKAAHELSLPVSSFSALYPALLQTLSPQDHGILFDRSDAIQSVLRHEEEIFAATLDKGMRLLHSICSKQGSSRILPAETVFDLYSTYGFPMDLTEMVARGRGWGADLEEWKAAGLRNTFVGYACYSTDAEVTAVRTLDDGRAELVIEPSPFYGHGGGQVPDRGTITAASGVQFIVEDVLRPYDDVTVLRVRRSAVENTADVAVGDVVAAAVDAQYREQVAVHHSATHLLNASLKQILGAPVVQAGSLVSDDRLRFDFTFNKLLTSKQLAAVEQAVNAAALSSHAVLASAMPLSAAKDQGAVATFSEKYGETVRVVQMGGISMELCGGTHVANTKDIYPFVILSEGSVAAGTRRIEAVAGQAAVAHLGKQSQLLKEAAMMLKSEPEDVTNKVDKLFKQLKDQRKEIEALSERLSNTHVGPEPVRLHSTGGQQSYVLHVCDQAMDIAYAKRRAHLLRAQEPSAAHIVLCRDACIVALDSKRVTGTTANEVLQKLLAALGGRGGGQREMAQGKLEKDTLSIVHR